MQNWVTHSPWVASYWISALSGRMATFFLRLLVLKGLLLLVGGCAPDSIELGQTNYQPDQVLSRCEKGSRSGSGGIIDGESTVSGIKYNVRTPANYDPTIGHPLLVVYAPARRSRAGTERFTGLTLEATAAGFIIAYANHRPLSKSAIVEFGTIPNLITKKWCIDKDRIYLSGHSDGGSIAMGLALLEETKQIPSAIAPSAAGIKRSDLTRYFCPEPISVMVMHGTKDSLFPGYGKEAAVWWATCNGCDSIPGQRMDDNCVAYSNCTNKVSIWYCEGSTSHSEWPQINSSMIRFFSSLTHPIALRPATDE